MKREAQYKQLPVANYLRRWINLKKVFELGKSAEPWDDPMRIKKQKPVVKGMEDMLQLSGLKLEGRHHSGIDDARNLARCVIKQLQSGFTFNQAMVHVQSNY
jgi:hypothetical protein